MKADLKPLKESTDTAPWMFFSFLGLHGLTEVATVPQFQPEDIQPKQASASLGTTEHPALRAAWSDSLSIDQKGGRREEEKDGEESGCFLFVVLGASGPG